MAAGTRRRCTSTASSPAPARPAPRERLPSRTAHRHASALSLDGPRRSPRRSTTTTDSYGTPDADGNTTTRPGQTLNWDVPGKPAGLTKTATGQQQSSVYDAEGNLLVQADPVTGTTAYLGDTQLHTAPGSSTVSASRTYTIDNIPIGERDTTAGVAGSTLYFLDADTVATVTTEIRATDGAVTRRYADPFGNARGAAATWSSARGYLNAPTSSFSALTQLGVRDHDPTLGRFISPDPILDVTRAVHSGHLICEAEATGRSGASIIEQGVDVGGYTRDQAEATVAAAEATLC